jgi:DNA-binding CsgD family transcriptional regulator
MLDPLLRKGRESYARRDWPEAYGELLGADRAKPLDAEDLERLATAACLIGHEEEFLRLLERLHRVHVEADDRERAARAAFWLALTFLSRGDAGHANAWTARGEHLVGDRDCLDRGYLLLPVAEGQLRDGDPEAAHATAAAAAAIGKRCQDVELYAAARHAQGRALLQLGRVAAGLKHLDETMLAVVAGELSPLMTGLMYCSVIEACHDVYELGRAREWTLALSRWCEEQPGLVAFSWACMVHRAEILRFQGEWPAALEEAGRACERAARAERRPPGAALYQQAEVHRLRGEHARADEKYRGASARGFEPQPGLALLRLAEGRAVAAVAGIRRLLLATDAWQQRGRLLPAYVEIMLATDELDEAGRGSLELEALTGKLGSEVLRAAALQAEGAVALARGDAGAAVAPLRRSFELWQRLEAPYEAARVRVLIGRACRALGDAEASTLELDAARAAFVALGARTDLARLGAPHDAAAPAGALTPRERQVLRLIAAGRTNKGIAGELGLSERTIDRHVGNVLTKFDVPSRAAAIAFAYSHKLL